MLPQGCGGSPWSVCCPYCVPLLTSVTCDVQVRHHDLRAQGDWYVYCHCFDHVGAHSVITNNQHRDDPGDPKWLVRSLLCALSSTNPDSESETEPETAPPTSKQQFQDIFVEANSLPLGLCRKKISQWIHSPPHLLPQLQLQPAGNLPVPRVRDWAWDRAAYVQTLLLLSVETVNLLRNCIGSLFLLLGYHRSCIMYC